MLSYAMLMTLTSMASRSRTPALKLFRSSCHLRPKQAEQGSVRLHALGKPLAGVARLHSHFSGGHWLPELGCRGQELTA